MKPGQTRARTRILWWPCSFQGTGSWNKCFPSTALKSFWKVAYLHDYNPPIQSCVPIPIRLTHFGQIPKINCPLIPGLNPQMPILWLVQFPFDVCKIPNYCWSTSPYIVFNTPSEAKVWYYFGCHVLIDRVNPPLLIAIFYYIVII